MLSATLQRYMASLVRTHFPPQKRGRPPKLNVEDALEMLFDLMRTGKQWREVRGHISYSSLNKYFHKWKDAGLFTTLYCQMLRRYKRRYKTEFYCIDSTYVKNLFGVEGMGRNPTDRGRLALKVSVIVDQNGIVHSLVHSPGNKADVSLLGTCLEERFVPFSRGMELLADKGYDSRANSKLCRKYGLLDRIARRKTKTGRRTNGKRSIVERNFSWIDKNRRLLVNYERTPEAHLALILFFLCNRLSTTFGI